MPKVDFTDKCIEFENWLDKSQNPQKVSPNNYIVYATSDNTIIMRPIKSTPTYDYAMVTFMSQTIMDEWCKKLEDMGYFVSRPKRYIWDIDKIG